MLFRSEIEDEVHDEGRFREVAVLADDLKEDEDEPVLAGEEADADAEEEDEVLSITLEDEESGEE